MKECLAVSSSTQFVHSSMNVVHFFRNMVLGEAQGHSHTLFNNCFYFKILNVCWEFVCTFHDLLTAAWSVVIPEKLTDSQLVKNSPHFIEPEGLFRYLQVPATCPYP